MGKAPDEPAAPDTPSTPSERQSESGRAMSKKILICTGDFGESLEVYYLYFRLKEAGMEPMIAAPKEKVLQLVVHDFEPQYDGYTEKLGYRCTADTSFADADPAEFDGLLLPGGRAPEEIRNDNELLHIIRYFLMKDKPIGAMCHGVMLLYTAGSIEDVECTSYVGIQPDVEMAGGLYNDEEVVVHENLVTSRGWPDMAPFTKAFLAVLDIQG